MTLVLIALCSFLVSVVSSSLRQSLLSLQSQHAAELASSGSPHVSPMKSMINLGSEFYAKAVVYGRSAHCALGNDASVHFDDRVLTVLVVLRCAGLWCVWLGAQS